MEISGIYTTDINGQEVVLTGDAKICACNVAGAVIHTRGHSINLHDCFGVAELADG